MMIRVGEGAIDIKPGSIFRFLLESWFGEDWNTYEIIYLEKVQDFPVSIVKAYVLHNEFGPATVKTDGTMEWWVNGEKLFCKTQQEFECYMRNKAFW